MTDHAIAGSWRDDVTPDAFETAVEILQAAVRERATVVVAAHVGPDGDALGSALALHAALSDRGVRSLPTVGEDPLKVPAAMVDLPRVGDLVPPARLPPPSDVDVLVTVDAASPARLGSIVRYLDAGIRTIVLDHHATAVAFGDVRLVAPRAAATVQVAAELLDRLGYDLTVDIATCLYIGLVTDTGRFGHAVTDRGVMELAGRLLDAGVDHAELTRRLYDTRSLGELRLLGRALDRLGFEPDVALVHTYVTAEELARFGSGIEATEALVDVLRTADVAEVALVLKPDRDGRWRGSLRSRGTVDVGHLAAALDGGGHAYAAGFTAPGDPSGLVARIVELLREE